jgi:ABC-2 type transport system permease protein
MTEAIAVTTSTVRGMLAVAKTQTMITAQYRSNMAVWSASSLVQLIVYMSVWQAVSRASGGAISGYSTADFAGYFMVLLVVRDLTFSWMPWNFPDEVKSGNLSPLMLRPLHPLCSLWANMLAIRFQGTLLLLPMVAILWFLFDANLNTTVAAIAVTAALIPLAAFVRGLSDSLLAMISFWLVRIEGIRGIYYFLLLLLGGQFAPIGVLPHWMQIVAKALPLWWTLGYPVELAMGRESLASAPIGLAVLTFWAVVLFVAVRIVWRKGARKYGAVGA